MFKTSNKWAGEEVQQMGHLLSTQPNPGLILVIPNHSSSLIRVGPCEQCQDKTEPYQMCLPNRNRKSKKKKKIKLFTFLGIYYAYKHYKMRVICYLSVGILNALNLWIYL